MSEGAHVGEGGRLGSDSGRIASGQSARVRLACSAPATEYGIRPLKALGIVVVGGGPAGLATAMLAAREGAAVTIVEKAGDPRRSDPGYSDRSFAITINDVGRYVLGTPPAWDGGVQIVGRAIHNYLGSQDVEYIRYGQDLTATMVSIPRPVLRQNLVRLSEAQGVSLVFDAPVTSVDPLAGTATYVQNGATRQLSAHLVVIADGVHSVSDHLVQEVGGERDLRTEPKSYVAALVRSTVDHGLSLAHLHYWHEPGKEPYAIGVPNLDGSVNVLFISEFGDVEATAHPFASPETAQFRLSRDFPQLVALDPSLPDQLPHQRRGAFYYKTTSTWAVGPRGVIVGDSGRAYPPWAGFGANTGIYSAGLLIHALVSNGGDVQAALEVYEGIQGALSRELLDYVLTHGEFLGGRVATHPTERSAPALAGLIATAHRRAAVQQSHQLA